MALPNTNTLPTTLTIRTSSPQPALTQPSQAISLLNLPTDILHLLLLHLPSLPSLHTLLLTHRAFANLFSQHPTSITTALISRSYPPHALRLLNYSRPNALHPKVRAFISTQTDGLWGRVDSSLAPSSDRFSTQDALRLKADAEIVDKLVHWAEGIMEGRSIIGYSEPNSGGASGSSDSGGRRIVYPLFDGQGLGSGVSASERERARKGVYMILGLVGSFVYDPERDEIDLDCTELLGMPLEELFYVLALLTYFSTWTFARELMALRRLVKVLEYRVYDDRKVVDVDERWDLRYSVEYLRRVGLRDRWQGEVAEMVAVSKSKAKGFDGGYRRERFEEKVIGGRKVLLLRFLPEQNLEAGLV
ncbi:hypothetical protein BJ508DRAFT_413824 [Ascobolus immersus RN42]|uniref:F-box domain-containing protein n=1 Tax=Ascobolus immersus RN42 TaxID=1160509 RepID=A0A3N4IFE1_ASCIM|nr:hypothetical protein BJ508DRAFT_413824 [Ascobolus immersus RN42]